VIELDTQVIGDLMVDIGDAWAQAEVADKAMRVQADLGWVIHPDFGGRGLATEAVREVFQICFEQLRLRRVTAGCFSANEPSWRLMERLGMRRETPYGQRITAPLRQVARRVRLRTSRRGVAASGGSVLRLLGPQDA
jgi:RimJ/RimL family protein N-acetyltransferase